jgi:hypothetical protein
VQKTIKPRRQNARWYESMPASELEHGGDEGRKFHAFPEHRREAPFRPPARLSLLAGTTNR